MSWITWCSCHRRILTTGQMLEGKKCEICQAEEHAINFPNDPVTWKREDEE